MDSQNEKIEEIEGNLHHMMNSTFQNKEKFMQLTEELMVRASGLSSIQRGTRVHHKEPLA